MRRKETWKTGMAVAALAATLAAFGTTAHSQDSHAKGADSYRGYTPDSSGNEHQTRFQSTTNVPLQCSDDPWTQAKGRIVIPAAPTKAQQFGAEELQIFLKKMTGATVPIEKTDRMPSGPAMIIGAHPANAAVIGQLKKQYSIEPGSWKTAGNYDAFAVVGDGGQLHLVGNTESATLFAVWDFLESLGVRWIMPTENGTYVPALKDIALPTTAKFEAPAYACRGPCYVTGARWQFPASSWAPEHGVPTSALWGFRQRANFNAAFDVRDSYPGLGSGHSYMYFLPVDKYYKDHPEWFAMKGGKRQSTWGWQVCFTNADAAKEAARNAITYIEGSLKQGIPIERMQLSISPNDNRAWCECPKCQKLVDADGSATSLVTLFANRVAEAVHKKYPQVRIMFYAYNNHARPGDHVKPGPGVCPELCFWSANVAVGANSAKPMFSDANDRFRRYFTEYARISDGVSSHPYYGHYTVFTPWPMLDQMAHDLKEMARFPANYGMYSENHLHWGTQGPNFYLYNKLLWNPNIDAKAMMDDYFAKGYGPAGPAIRKYFRVLQTRMNALPYICGYMTEIPAILSPEVIAQCNDCIDQAEGALAKMDPATQWRTKLIIDGWRYSVKTAVVMRLLGNPQPGPGDGAKAARLLKEILDFVGTEQGQWVFETMVTKPTLLTYYKPFAVPLTRLPAGTATYSDYMSYGGTIKFFATMQGFRQGMWGYSVAPGGQASVELPIRAEPGGRLDAATVNLSAGSGDKCAIRISVAGNGTEKTLFDAKDPVRKPLAFPAEVLGGREAELRIHVQNTSRETQLALVELNLSVTVKPEAARPKGQQP